MLSPLERSFSGRKRESLDTVDSFPRFSGQGITFPTFSEAKTKFTHGNSDSFPKTRGMGRGEES